MRIIDADVLIQAIDPMYIAKKGIVSDTFAEGCIQFEKLIKEQPTINQWIPVSERLPKSGVQVICCNDDGRVFTSCRTGLSFIDGNQYHIFGQHYGVIAWMPLPEPYKGEE